MVTEADVYETLKYYRVVVDRYGTRRYYNSANQLHRDDGPAVVTTVGTRYWYQNNLLHREDGPAIERNDGTMHWILHGISYTEVLFRDKVRQNEHRR